MSVKLVRYIAHNEDGLHHWTSAGWVQGCSKFCAVLLPWFGEAPPPLRSHEHRMQCAMSYRHVGNSDDEHVVQYGRDPWEESE